MRGALERRRDRGGTCGGRCPIVWGVKLERQKKKKKYIVALDGHQLMIDLLCNNQPKTGFRNGGGYEGEVW